MFMRKDRSEALQLRKSGKSYAEIKKALGIPKSTLSEWLRSYSWSKKIRRSLAEKSKQSSSVRIRTLDRIRGERLRRAYREAADEARGEFEALKYHPLFIAGVMIYWGEGDKISEHGVRIANTDPRMIKVFVNFLVHVCQIPTKRIRGWVLIYPDLDGQSCRKYWAEHTGLGVDNFSKNITIKGRHKTHRLQYGVCNVGISSKYFKQKMLVWLERLPVQLLKREYYSRV